MSARFAFFWVGAFRTIAHVFLLARFFLKSISIHALTRSSNGTPLSEMTSGPNALKAALQRLIAGNASDVERDAVPERRRQ